MSPLQYHSLVLKLLLILATNSLSCGAVQSGNSSSSLNDPRPTGPLMKQGQFGGQNGQSVSGSALIFNNGPPNYIARLEGISTPNETGLQVWVMPLSGNALLIAPLHGFSGNQNYNFSTSTPTFTSVCIQSTQKNSFYGCAQLF